MGLVAAWARHATEDDGVGFDPAATKGSSLTGRSDRIEAIGLFGFQRGVMVASRSQFGLPA